MKTAPHHVVGISYQLKEKGTTEIIENVSATDPFVFLLGSGNLLEAFEHNLSDKSVGDTFDFILESEEAYGPIDENAIVNIPIDVFFINGVFAEDLVVVGKPIRMQDNQGNPLVGMVLERGLETVKIDFNHPMAGKALHFTGEIVSLRPATEEELAHGHVHGPGGHQH